MDNPEGYWRSLADTVGHRWQVRAVSLLAGDWFYGVQCRESTCPAYSSRDKEAFGVASSVEALEVSDTYEMPCQPRQITINYTTTRSTLMGIAEQYGHLPVQRPDAQIHLSEPSPEWWLAVDASVGRKRGRSGCAVVTGAGWVFYDSVDEVVDNNAMEFRAVTFALHRLPQDTPKYLLVDSQETAALIEAMKHGEQVYRPWATATGVKTMRRLLNQHPDLFVQWRPRNTGLLMSAADHASRAAAEHGGLSSAELPCVRWEPMKVHKGAHRSKRVTIRAVPNPVTPQQ